MQSVGSEPTLSVNMWIQQVRSLLSFRSGRYQDFGQLCRLVILTGSVLFPCAYLTGANWSRRSDGWAT